jgi:hypothetical protein
VEDLFFNNIGELLLELELESVGVLCYEVDLSFNNYIDFVNCYYEDVIILLFIYFVYLCFL